MKYPTPSAYETGNRLMRRLYNRIQNRQHNERDVCLILLRTFFAPVHFETRHSAVPAALLEVFHFKGIPCIS